MSSKKPFAQKWWGFLYVKAKWERGFHELLADGQRYERLGTDDYDSSLEIIGAANDWRLTEAQQRYLAEAGFAIVYVNHKDGWETHYRFFGKDRPIPARGWRRRYVSDPTGPGDRIIVGEPDPGYWEISYWPEGWDSERMQEDRKRGYYRIVPDPLEQVAGD